MIENQILECRYSSIYYKEIFVNCKFTNFDLSKFQQCTFQNCTIDAKNTLRILLDKSNKIISGRIENPEEIFQLLKSCNIDLVDALNKSILLGYTKYPQKTQAILVTCENKGDKDEFK